VPEVPKMCISIEIYIIPQAFQVSRSFNIMLVQKKYSRPSRFQSPR
jgi:hypothetical protein